LHFAYLSAYFVLANFYRFFVGEDYAYYADYVADCAIPWHFYARDYLDVLHCGWFYGRHFAHQPRAACRAVYGERFLRDVGEVDLEVPACSFCGDRGAVDVRRANRLLMKNDKMFPLGLEYA
jgi:hypothetical protein